MILNKIKELYFARFSKALDEASWAEGGGAGAPTEDEVGVLFSADNIAKAKKGLEGAQVLSSPEEEDKVPPGALPTDAREDSGITVYSVKKIPGSDQEGFGGVDGREITYVYSEKFGGNPKLQIMVKDPNGPKEWKDKRGQPIDIATKTKSPHWKTILAAFLPAEVAAQFEDEGAGTTPSTPPSQENYRTRAGEFLATVEGGEAIIEDPKLLAKVTQHLKTIGRNMIRRAKMVRVAAGAGEGPVKEYILAKPGEEGAEQQGHKWVKKNPFWDRVPAWARSDGMAGTRATGKSSGSWEMTLATARGVRETPAIPASIDPTTGEEIPEKKATIISDVSLTEDEIIESTFSRNMFEAMAAGQMALEKCGTVKNYVKFGKKNEIAFVRNGVGVVKEITKPERDAIERIIDNCKCTEDAEFDGCIEVKGGEERSTIFGQLATPINAQTVNDYVGKFTETLRVVGIIARVYEKIKDTRSDEDKAEIKQKAQDIMTAAMHEDARVHAQGLARLQQFVDNGGNIEAFEDANTLREINALAPDRKGLWTIISRIEADDLRARDPDMVFTVGLITGSGKRDDNVEVHLKKEDMIDALVNQGLTKGAAEEHVRSIKVGELPSIGVTPEQIEIFKLLYPDVEDDTEIFYNGLSLKNEVHDESTKFGQQSREEQSKMVMLDDELLSEDQSAFRTAALEYLGLDTKFDGPDMKSVREVQHEHEEIQRKVYGLFPDDSFMIKDSKGKKQKVTAASVVSRIRTAVESEFPLTGEGEALRTEMLELFDDNTSDDGTWTPDQAGRVREKLTRILTAHKTHTECNQRHKKTNTAREQRKGELTETARNARKHLAVTSMFAGGVLQPTLVSKRGLKKGTVKIYSQNEVIVPALQGMMDGTFNVEHSGGPEKDTTSGDEVSWGATTRIISPNGKHIRLTREATGSGALRHTLFSVMVGQEYLEEGKHVYKATQDLFSSASWTGDDENTENLLSAFLQIQQDFFKKLMVEH